MGKAKLPRVWRSGPYFPSSPRTGNEGDNVSWRKSNLITRGRDGRFYEEAFAGLGEIDRIEEDGVGMVQLTGTLTLTEGSTEIVGTGTLFRTECPFVGQRIMAFNSDNSISWLLVVRHVVDDTHMEVWKAPDGSATDCTGWRMPRLFAVNDMRGSMLWGNAIRLDKGSLLAVGMGTLRLNGEVLPGESLVGTANPQIALLAMDGTYDVFTLGMDDPPTPALSAIAGGVKGMQAGNYSVVITPARKQTAGFNNPSQRADVTLATGDMVRITFPAMDTANGQNSWFVWVTTFAFSLGADLNYLNGPWFFLMEVTDEMVSSAGGTFDVEWLDAEVEGNEIVSFDNDPPPQATFIEMLNFTAVWLGCRGPSFERGVDQFIDPPPGPYIAPSKQNNIEAAPVGVQFASSPPETIIGGISANGRIHLLTTNHLQIAQSTPDENVPTLIRPFWKSGFACPEQVVFVGDKLYGYPVSGPTRSADNGDETTVEHNWAADVFEITRHWNPGQVLVAENPTNNSVVFFHIADHRNDAGFWTTAWLEYGVPQLFWIGAGVIESSFQDMVVSGVATVSDKMYVIAGGRLGDISGESGWVMP